MSTKDYVIRLSVTALIVLLLIIVAIAGVGLFDARVDNARIYPLLSTLANTSIGTIATIIGAWTGYEFGKAALEAQLKEAREEIARLRDARR